VDELGPYVDETALYLECSDSSADRITNLENLDVSTGLLKEVRGRQSR